MRRTMAQGYAGFLTITHVISTPHCHRTNSHLLSGISPLTINGPGRFLARREHLMRRGIQRGYRFVGRSLIVLMATQLFVWNSANDPIAAAGDPVSAAISQANLTKLINSSISLRNLPSSLTPSLNELENNGDYGGSLLDSSSCGSLGTNAWQENIAHCYFGDTKSKTTLALVGDSRASMYLDTFAKLGAIEHFRVLFIAKDGCPIPLGTYMTNNDGTLSDGVWTACSSFHSYLIAHLDKIKPRVIVVSSNTEIDLTNPVHYAQAPEIQTDMEALLSKLPRSSRVIVLGGFPQPAEVANPTVCLSRNPSNVSSCAFTPSSGTVSDNAAFATAAADERDVFVNQTPWFCTSTCPAVIGNYVPYTVDAYHADNTYLQFLIGVIWSSIRRYIA